MDTLFTPPINSYSVGGGVLFDMVGLWVIDCIGTVTDLLSDLPN